MSTSDLAALTDLAARLGGNPLLSHAFTGNVSMKLGDVLWIKATGTCLADARTRQILTPVAHSETLACVRSNDDAAMAALFSAGERLRPSVETPMHAVLGHRVVIHVHSVNTIAWAVRSDGKERLASRLAGLRWKWVRYVPSGLPLAREAAKVARRGADVLILANHGLVVGADTCAAAEALLHDVESRLWIAPRPLTQTDESRLKYLIDKPGWTVASDTRMHSLCADRISQRILGCGVLYPCHALFLRPTSVVFDAATRVSDALRVYVRRHGAAPNFLLIKDAGVLTSENISGYERELLIALAEVLRRIPEHAPVRRLTGTELSALENGGSPYHQTHVATQPSDGGSLTPDELERLYNAVVAERNKRHVAIFTMVCRCAMAPSELTELRMGDVDPRRLDAETAAAVEPWLQRMGDRTDAFFANGSRRPMSMNELDAMIRYYGAIAGVPPRKRRAIAITTLRRSAAAS